MRRESGATGWVAAAAGADPAEAWIKEWRRLIPPPGVWWRKSAFDFARARRANRLRPWRWLTEPVATFRIWLATGRLSPAERSRWNRRAEVAAGADRLLSALDPYQRRAAACFEDRAMVTAGAGSGKTRTMVARAGYAARRLRTPPKAIAFITFTNKATEEIRQRTRERLPGLQVGTIHQLARRVLKLVDGRTVQLSPVAECTRRWRSRAFRPGVRRVWVRRMNTMSTIAGASAVVNPFTQIMALHLAPSRPVPLVSTTYRHVNPEIRPKSAKWPVNWVNLG